MERKNITSHIIELKKRVISIFVVFLILFTLFYVLSSNIYEILSLPLINITNGKTQFVFTGLAEGFFVKLDIAFKTAILFLIPFISYNVYKFIEPGLYKREKIIIKRILFSVPILFMLGAFFVYKLVMPNAFEFFLSFEENSDNISISFLAKMNEYISIVTSLIIAFGLAFQLPVILLILVFLNILNSISLVSSRRIAIVVIFIISAFITPPDVLSQFLLAIPLMGLYEITIFLARKLESEKKNA
jgi:sec-independent protein translocase protein TatC